MALARQANGLPLTYRPLGICAVPFESTVEADNLAFIINHFIAADYACFHFKNNSIIV